MYQFPVYPRTVLVSRDYYDGVGDDYHYERNSDEEHMKKTVYQATHKDRKEPDWELNMDVVDQINTKAFGHEDAKKAIAARLGHKEAHVVLLTLVLLETCMNNCGIKLHRVIGTKNFLGSLLKHAQQKIKYFEQKKKDDADKEKGKLVKPPKETSSKKELNPKQLHKKQLRKEIEEKVLKLLHAWNGIEHVDAYNSWHSPVYYQYIYEKLTEKGVEFPPITDADRPSHLSIIARKQQQKQKEIDSKRTPLRLPNVSTTSSRVMSKEYIEKLASNSELLVDCIHQAHSDLDVLSNALVQELVPILEKGRKAVEDCISRGNVRDETELGSMLSINDTVSQALDLYHIVESRIQVFEDIDDSRLRLPSPPKQRVSQAAVPAAPFDPSTSASITSMIERLDTTNGSDEEEELFLFGDEDDEEHRQIKELFERRKKQKEEEDQILKWLDQSGGDEQAFPSIESDKSGSPNEKDKRKKKKKNGFLKKFIGGQESSDTDNDDDEDDDEDDAPLENKRKGKK